MSRIGGLLRRTFGVIKEHVGWIVWAKWVVVAVNATEFEYLEGSISSEWDAGEESELQGAHRRQGEGGGGERELLPKEYEEGLVAWPTQTIAEGHAAFSVGQPETSEEHVRTANIFQPDSWTPTKCLLMFGSLFPCHDTGT
uniref:Uncharacterized protein n=1 Tax=Oncorhynchus tshawytscha TaxID=74940 RepID=A0A8C8HD28_ONCTS